MRILLLRHTPVNLVEGICYGRSDVELAPDWGLHFAATRRKVSEKALATAWVYSSPLRRCLDLANELAGEVVTDERLREMDFGHWEMRRWDDVPEAEIRTWSEDIVDAAPPGGESLREVSERVGGFLDELEDRGHEFAILVTHGGVIRCALARMLGMPLPNALRLRVDYGSATQVRVRGGVIQVEYVNR